MRQTMEKCFIHFKLWFFVIVEEVRLPKKKKRTKKCLSPLANVSSFSSFVVWGLCCFLLFFFFCLYFILWFFLFQWDGWIYENALLGCFFFCFWFLEWLQSKPQVYSFHIVMEEITVLMLPLRLHSFSILPLFPFSCLFGGGVSPVLCLRCSITLSSCPSVL